jgi:hypothetical protein
MIIKNPPRLPASSGLAKYVQSDLYSWIKNFVSGVNGRLSFDDNFASFISKDIVIAAGAEVLIPNQLQVVPNERYIARQIGNGVITDGVWDQKTLRLVNNGAVSVTVSVRFFHVYRFTA